MDRNSFRPGREPYLTEAVQPMSLPTRCPGNSSSSSDPGQPAGTSHTCRICRPCFPTRHPARQMVPADGALRGLRLGSFGPPRGIPPAQRLSSKRTDDLLLPGRGHLREDGGRPPDGSGGKPSGSLSGSRGSLPGRLNGHAWPGCLRRSCRLHASKRRQSRDSGPKNFKLIVVQRESVS